MAEVRKLTLALLMSCASIGSPALAQTAGAPQTATARSGATEESSGAVSEIIVTARRVAERLQDVPISMTVVNADTLSKANIVTSTDLTKVAPGLQANMGYSPEMASFSIRGFSRVMRTSATVGVYFADVVAPRGGGASLTGGDGTGAANMFDLESIQVLKGPQGTLFGRNTTGGAVLMAPKKPSDKFEGYVEGSYGNYDLNRLQAVVNLPLNDQARLRLGVDRMTQEGYIHNLGTVGPARFNNTNYTAARAALVLDLTPELENYTIGSYFKSSHMPGQGQLFRNNPATVFGRLAQPQVDRLNASGDYWAVEQHLANPLSWTRQWQLINTTTWRPNEDLTVKNIASYSRYQQIIRTDVFSTNFPFPNAANRTGTIWTSIAFAPDNSFTNDQENYTEELQFQGRAMNARLNWQAGLYYEKSKPSSPIASIGPSTGAICSLTPFTDVSNVLCMPSATANVNYNTAGVSFTNLGVYAQGVYAITDKLKGTAGLRFTDDKSSGFVTSLNYPFVGAPRTFVNPSAPVCAPGYPAPSCSASAKTHSSKPTWTLSLTYNVTPDQMVYGSYSRGYRQGAVSPLSAISALTFEPETLDTYEIGAKTSFHGLVSGRFNIAAFYSKLKNQQIQFGLQNSVTGLTGTSVFNAGRSRMDGVEADTSVVFTDWFRVDAAVSYLDTKLISLAPQGPFPQFNVVLPSALPGDALPNSPMWSGNVGGTITLPVPESVGHIEFGATYRFQAKYETAASTSSSLRATPVRQVDLNFNWNDVAARPVDLTLFATNVTNQKTFTGYTPLFSSFGFDYRNLGVPRMYGLRVRARFGEGVWN